MKSSPPRVFGSRLPLWAYLLVVRVCIVILIAASAVGAVALLNSPLSHGLKDLDPTTARLATVIGFAVLGVVLPLITIFFNPDTCVPIRALLFLAAGALHSFAGSEQLRVPVQDVCSLIATPIAFFLVYLHFGLVSDYIERNIQEVESMRKLKSALEGETPVNAVKRSPSRSKF